MPIADRARVMHHRDRVDLSKTLRVLCQALLGGQELFAVRRYQFQSFAQYRGKLAMKSAEELEGLRAADDVWSVLGVPNDGTACTHC